MTMEVETLVAVSLIMAVFSAVAAIGTSIVLGAGFERLRTGFEVVRKQTGFFSDAIHKLDKKVAYVNKKAGSFSESIETLEAKVSEVGQQANAFGGSMEELERKVEVVDKQTGFFSDAIHKLEQKVETVSRHEEVVAEKMQQSAETDLISTGKAEALVSHAEDLLGQMTVLANQIHEKSEQAPEVNEQQTLHLPKNIAMSFFDQTEEGEEIRYH